MLNKPRGTVIAALVHDLVKARRFDTEGDLIEATKCRCATLRIPYDSARVVDAIALVSRTRPVVAELRRPKPELRRAAAAVTLDDLRPPISRGEAASILQRLFPERTVRP